MHIKTRRGWEISENLVTPESVFFNRRLFMGGVAAAILPRFAHAETGSLYPAKLNNSFADAKRPLTDETAATTFNNFYEYGASKQISEAAKSLITRPWPLIIDGEVEAAQTIDFEDLLKKVTLEERVVRHRCVEAWAMVVPWTGFPLQQLVALAKPKASAKYIRFETFNNPDMAPGQKPGLFSSYPWPYVEGLTMAEASNELAFMVTGAYGKPLPNSMGAPIRLHTPWKYGFKSVKSIVRISFTQERPISFWETINASEYGFWANVNPEVSHPRWSQAEEQMLGSGERRPTQIFNGYGEFVAGLYKGMEDQPLYM
jgi:methionine sulfoxide reductase catalytic subunit